jgi:Flp pilus assembly protein TadD
LSGGAIKVGLLCVLAVVATALSTFARAQEVQGCGNLRNAFGPFDFRDAVAKRDALPMVEAYHFTREVESLQQGKSGYVMGDIDYTLRAFPNHPRALNAMSRYALGGGKTWPNVDVQSADCYFMRAIAFQPEDPVPHLLFGNYLQKRNKRDDARAQYEEALRLAPQSPDVNYNAGLYFLSIGELDRAKALAKVAYDDGYPLPGLRTKIEAAEAAAQPKR